MHKEGFTTVNFLIKSEVTTIIHCESKCPKIYEMGWLGVDIEVKVADHI